MKEKYYVTTAIAYPNAKPHLGHALEIIQADIVARFHRLLDMEVFFQTGTDEHGVKNWDTAKKEGKEIKKFLDGNVKVFKEMYDKLNISYDNFIRTSDKKIHHPGAKKLWKELVKSGDIYKQNYKGLYCTGCEAFKLERELEDGKCPDHPTRKIETVEEENYFFKLSKYKDQVIENIEKDEYKIIPKIRKNEILSFLKDAKDISFSRPKKSLPWGISVPDDEDHVMYVWCDALSNYITGIGYGRDEDEFNEIWPANVHIIGKDILRFHAAFWPAMLLSAGIALPRELFVHGFILSKGSKMSKSTGNVIEPFEQIEKYGIDQFRFYITGAMPMEGDGDYNEELVVERINTELVGNISNFLYRAFSFTNKNFDSEIKDIDEDPVIGDISEKFEEIKNAYQEFDLKKAVEGILAVSALGNKYIQDNEPWKLVKEDKNKVQKIFGTCINIAKNISILIQPIMPGFSEDIQKQLDLEDLKWKDLNFELRDHKIKKAKILFKKVDEADEIDKKEGKEKAENNIPLNLKVGKVLEAEDVEDSDKLVKMQVDLGEEKRQIVAGIKQRYSAKDLAGKNLVILTNLKPAKLAGVESNGMMLAGGDEKTVTVLEPSGKPGDKVFAGDEELNYEGKIDFKKFKKIKFEVNGKRAVCEGKILKTDKEIEIDLPDGSKVS